ncbi:hypothetical protein QMK19_38910 [Streptomyces sp. H10-C2]|uniref:hypothetical protein n=1 Tax=unclassified Streptomyces TaxID=2593676 RepID=UPI0024BB4CB3|nr:MULTISPECIES: hypothetical protein [unclassified Streptomyces]MDJ0347147.1 hypothetical protein [Streptomyces sp. PH10-H1]MDJ0375406.1 hypothetical protein [Streptomyces sp. H10-C2]
MTDEQIIQIIVAAAAAGIDLAHCLIGEDASTGRPTIDGMPVDAWIEDLAHRLRKSTGTIGKPPEHGPHPATDGGSR